MGTFLQSTATNVHLNSPTDCYCYSCVNLKCCGCSLTHQMYTVGITANWAPFLLTAGVGGGVAILMPGLASICASPPDTIFGGVPLLHPGLSAAQENHNWFKYSKYLSPIPEQVSVAARPLSSFYTALWQ